MTNGSSSNILNARRCNWIFEFLAFARRSHTLPWFYQRPKIENCMCNGPRQWGAHRSTCSCRIFPQMGCCGGVDQKRGIRFGGGRGSGNVNHLVLLFSNGVCNFYSCEHNPQNGEGLCSLKSSICTWKWHRLQK